jgi:hypothetical protein
MTKLSGEEFESHYNGSSGEDGEIRSSENNGNIISKETGGWIRINNSYFKTLPDGTKLVSKKLTNAERDKDHAHFNNNHGKGPRQNSVKKMKLHESGRKDFEKVNWGKEQDLFTAIKKWLGID